MNKLIPKCQNNSNNEFGKLVDNLATYLPKYEYSIDVTPNEVAVQKHERVPEADWQNYWGERGASIVSQKMNEAAPYIYAALNAPYDIATAPSAVLGLANLAKTAIGSAKNFNRIYKVSKAIDNAVEAGMDAEKYGLSNFNRAVLEEDGFLGRGRLIHRGEEPITSRGIYSYPKVNMKQNLPGELKYTSEPSNIWWTNHGNVYGGRSANNSTIISVNRDAVKAADALQGKYSTTKGFAFTPEMDVKVTQANPFTRLLQPQSHIRYVGTKYINGAKCQKNTIKPCITKSYN